MTARDPRQHGARSSRLRAAAAWLLLAAACACLATPSPSHAEDEAKWEDLNDGFVIRAVDGMRIHAKHMFVNAYGSGLMRGDDTGAKLERVMKGVRPPPGVRNPARLTLDPDKPDKVAYLVTMGRVYRTDDLLGACNWTAVSSGLTSYSLRGQQNADLVFEVSVDPDKSARILAGTRSEGDWQGGLFESNDSGAKWNQVAGSNVAGSGLGNEAWPVVLKASKGGFIVTASRRGVWTAEKGPMSFEYRQVGEGLPDIRWMAHRLAGDKEVDLVVADARGIYVGAKEGESWPKAPNVEGDATWVGWHPAGKPLYGIVRGRGIVASADGSGKRWDDVSQPTEEFVELGFSRDPKQAKLVYGLSRVNGLWVSKDAGKTWQSVDAALPQAKAAVVAVGVNVKDGALIACSDEGVAYVSTDRGTKWAQAGRLSQAVLGMRQDADGSVYATGRRLLRSSDNGTTWQPVFTPASGVDGVVDMQVGADGRLWCVLERSAEVRVSSDKGQTWELRGRATEEDGLWASSLALDPRSPDVVVVGTTPAPSRYSGPKKELRDPKAGGVVASLDGGKTWASMSTGLPGERKDLPPRVRTVLVDPVSGCLYVAIQGYDAFVRPPVAGDGAQPLAQAWVALGVGGEKAEFKTPSWNGFAVARRGADSVLAVHVQGEAGKRAFMTVQGSALKGVASGAVSDPKALLTRLPDTRAQVSGLVADPSAPGRWLAGNVGEAGGVVAFGKGEAAAPSSPVPGPGPAPVAPAASKPEVPEGMLAFSASSDFVAAGWNMKAGSKMAMRGHGAAVTGVALSPDKTLVATASRDQSVRFWTASDLKFVAGHEVKLPEEFTAMRFTRDGKFLLVGTESGKLCVIEVATKNAEAVAGHAKRITAIAEAADGTIYTASLDRTLQAWGAADRKPSGWKVQVAADPFALAVWDNGGALLVAGGEPMLRAFSLSDGKEKTAVPLPHPMSMAVVVHPQAKRAYAGGEGSVQVVDLSAMALLPSSWAGPRKAVTALALSEDGEWLLSGDEGASLALLRTSDGAVAWTREAAHDEPVTAVGLSR